MTAALLHHLPKPKTTPKTFNWWVDKYTVVHPYMKYYLFKKLKQTTDTHINNVGSQRHYAKRKKPKTKGYILYDYIYITFWKRKNPRDRKLSSCCQGIEVQKGNGYKEAWGNLGSDGIVLYLGRGSGCMTVYVCQYSEHTLKMGEFYVCNLYLSKPAQKRGKLKETFPSFLHHIFFSSLVSLHMEKLNGCIIFYHLGELSLA